MLETLLAVGVGAALTAATGWLADSRQSRRHDRQQWHQQRLTAYTTTWTQLGHVGLAMQGLLTKHGKPRLVALPWASVRVLQQAGPVMTAIEQATEALTVIRFIGSQEVVDAADRCADVLVQLGDAIGDSSTTPEQVEALMEKLKTRRHHLVDVARAELDVDPQPVGRRRRKQLRTSQERIAVLDAPEPGNLSPVRPAQTGSEDRSPELGNPAPATDD
jgi:hypothetical protein